VVKFFPGVVTTKPTLSASLQLAFKIAMNSSTLGSPVTTFTFEEELLGVEDGEGEPLGVGPGAQPVSKRAAMTAALAFTRFIAQSYCSWGQVEKCTLFGRAGVHEQTREDNAVQQNAHQHHGCSGGI
jgi:hypothetical protein